MASPLNLTAGNCRVGWIGTGVMGRWMCEHVMKAGFTNMTVHNRTEAKTEPLRALGARVVATPREVAENSDVVFTIVGYPKDVRETYLGADGVLAGLKANGVCVDMTTSQPSLAEEIAKAAKAKGIYAVDAPVSGGDVGAKNATLSIMIGGEEAAVEALRPLFSAMGKNINRLGGPGAGQHTKMVNQVLISTTMIGVVEGLLYGYKAGLDLVDVIKAVGAGAAGSWSINNYGPRMIKRNFDPGFFVNHFVKDLEIALDESRRMNLSLPGLALAHQFYVALKAQGHGQLGTHSLLLAFEQMNHTKIDQPEKPASQ
ncbi:3-hydroxyisobutyrate dehydrogenase [Capsaspora owczarzaki ATCC 30864]|uniref:3-hydroxyisobutyrate dehydrogenase n=1 Tax=Capsaspora owczarzaki (strain ATCC 30864) TaxID=595528 RepID=A0A0D2UDZ7_CAPO3|nr:3-hydroxyisobutyrate dehydrogenase [Capsaspora owczarzaki ATCC 30864]KJE93326.1 3-hydroxyisobutyrate dehydrogenase [Capsaspora owczarzaki ATCC 30864]|eukprot:XP_004347956.1 3-hydroxyisobutyrate dehydrogenase [Capsaspora owczarzaki ATCC 30864]